MRYFIILLALAACAVGVANAQRHDFGTTDVRTEALEKIADDGRVTVYTFKDNGRRCWIAKTIHGVSLDCSRGN